MLSTHLGLRFAERRFQVRQLLEHIDERPFDFLTVLGDFNDWLPGQSVAHALDDRLGRARRVRTFPSWCPLLALDRVWVHPASTIRAVRVHKSPLARLASDHLPVVAELVLPR